MTVVDGLLGYRANAMRDADGRPLGEVSSPWFETVATEVVACPYPDGRRGKPMNRSALRQVSGVWPTVLSTVRGLAGPSATVHDAWRVALVGVAAPLVVGEPVPVVLSAMYKACLGLSQVTTDLLLGDDGVADARFADLGDGAAWFDALDRGGWLVGQVQVCAGTHAMLVQLGDALGGAPGPADLAPELPADPMVLADLAAVAVGVHAARFLIAEERRRAGIEGPRTTLPPWLRALTAIPDRPAGHVRRLFPVERCPAEVEEALRG